MNKKIEKELKILVSKEQFALLCNEYSTLTFVEQLNIYYDTKDHDIEKMKGAMRIRTKGNKHIFTLKMQSTKGLWEYECDVDQNSVKEFEQEEIKKILTSYQIMDPIMERTSLLTYRAKIVNHSAELCFDINNYNNKIDYEIEYEYLKEHDGIACFNKILSKANLQYRKNCKSKIERALSK